MPPRLLRMSSRHPTLLEVETGPLDMKKPRTFLPEAVKSLLMLPVFSQDFTSEPFLGRPVSLGAYARRITDSSVTKLRVSMTT